MSKPRERHDKGEQDLFRSRLDQIINLNHELVRLADVIDWSFLKERFGEVYSDSPGMPPLTGIGETWQADRGESFCRCGYPKVPTMPSRLALKRRPIHETQSIRRLNSAWRRGIGASIAGQIRPSKELKSIPP